VATVPDLPAVDSPTAQGQITAWLADIDERQRLREEGPPAEAIQATTSAWQRGDDDILPSRPAGRVRRQKAPKAPKPAKAERKSRKQKNLVEV
jgi:hypothetical protein